MKKIALCLSLVACAEAAAPAPIAPQPASSTTTSSAATAPAGAEPTVKKLEADTPITTASGATFEGPKGWTVTTFANRIQLETPEKDLTVTFIEVGETDGDKAIEKAWKTVKPSFALKAGQTVHPPAKDGWDSITQTSYLGGGEARSVIGIALGKGKTQYVALVDGANAGLDRRGAQLHTLVATFRAAGVTEESFAGKTAKPLDARALASIDETVRDVLAKMEVPGAAIAIVEHGKVVFEKGYGTKTLGKNAPVSPNTLFMIGSTTKSLTTLMMAKLVDEKKLSWDEPVTEILPSFALGDAEMTKKLTVKHTVCACTGLPRQDFEFLFEYANATPESRVGSMRDMKPTTGFGETFQYSNTLVATGGYVAAHAALPTKKLGPAYAESMQANVFGPLGMKSTTLDFSKVKKADHATGHAQTLDQTWTAIPIRDEEGVVALSPAGAVWSTAHDMARYVALELAKGKDANGRPIVSEANLMLRRTPQVKISDKSSYGLGLFVEDNHGVKVVGHGGNNMGFSSDLFFLPDHDIGVVLLYNGGSVNTVRNVVRRRVMEVLFDGPPETAKMIDFVKSATHDAVTKALSHVSKTDTAWSQTLAGTYSNPNLGQITVRVDNKHGATLDAGEWKSQFGKQTEDDGTVKLVLLEPPLAGLPLVPGPGRTLTLDTPQQKYVFTATK